MPIIDGTGKSRLLDLDERIDPSRTALLLIDVQKDFCDPEGVCARNGENISAMPAMLDDIRSMLAAARQAKMLIVFVRTSYDPAVVSSALTEVHERRYLSHGICVEGTTGIEFCDDTGPLGLANEIVVTKHRSSAWWGTDLDLILRSNGIKSVVLAGVETEGSVESTARAAFFKDYYLVIASEAVGSYSRARHDAALKILGHTFGRVIPSAQIKSIWEKASAGPRPWSPEQKSQLLSKGLRQRFDPANTAIIMINMQNDLCADGGSLDKAGDGISNIRKALPRMHALLSAGRAVGCRIVHVTSEYGPLTRHADSLHRHPTASTKGSMAMILGAQFAPGEGSDYSSAGSYRKGWSNDFIEGFGPDGDELLVVKHRISAFVDTRLDLLLRSNSVRSVIIAGVTTNCCVESAVREACTLDYFVTVAEDAVATSDQTQHLHRASLATMKNYFAQVIPVEAIAAAWSPVEHDVA